MRLTLFNYWRSSSSWRVRIALGMKGLSYEYVAVNLLEGAQWSAEHLRRNPTGQIPVLHVTHDDGRTLHLAQSLPIIEWLEESFPESTRLLPESPDARAAVRALAEHVNSGIQPFQNLSVMKRVGELGGDGRAWARGFIARGLESLEKAALPTAGAFAHGDRPTLADVCIVPQLGGARRFEVDVAEFPTLLRIEQNASQLSAFQAAAPERQPDAPQGQ